MKKQNRTFVPQVILHQKMAFCLDFWVGVNKEGSQHHVKVLLKHNVKSVRGNGKVLELHGYILNKSLSNQDFKDF